VNPLSAPIQMMGELLEVRLNDIRGLYDENSELAEENKNT
jgi:hypothetical protein